MITANAATRRPMTSTAALLAYDKACHTGDLESLAEAAHGLAEVLRATQRKSSAPKGDKTPAQVIGAALAPVLAIIEREVSIPCLGWVRIVSDGESLTFYGTDLDSLVSQSCPAFGIAPMDVCLSAQRLDAAFKSVKGDVSLTFEEVTDAPGDQVGWCTLKVRGVESRLYAYEAELFPMMPTPEPAFCATIDGEVFCAALAPVSIAISTKETRYYLNGAFLHWLRRGAEGDVLSWVATDGHRLARAHLPNAQTVGELPGNTPQQPGVIVPRKTVAWLLKNAKAGEIMIEVSAQKIRVTAGSLFILSKLIDGNYPDYQRVMPNGAPKAAFTLGKDGAAALTRLMAHSRERSKPVHFTIQGGEVLAELRTPGGDNFTATIPASDVEGMAEISFNALYVVDAAAHGAARLNVTDEARPCAVSYPDRPGRQAVLMPMRTR